MKRKLKCTVYTNHIEKTSFDRTIEEDYEFPGIFLEDSNLIIVTSKPSITPIGKSISKCYAKITINKEEFKINLNIYNKNSFLVNPATGGHDFSITIAEDELYKKFQIALSADQLDKELSINENKPHKKTPKV